LGGERSVNIAARRNFHIVVLLGLIVSASGGQAAKVLYAGLAPGFVGLFQLDIAIPENANTGSNMPISITINGVPGIDLVNRLLADGICDHPDKSLSENLKFYG
jgi:hypothetical protein